MVLEACQKLDRWILGLYNGSLPEACLMIEGELRKWGPARSHQKAEKE